METFLVATVMVATAKALAAPDLATSLHLATQVVVAINSNTNAYFARALTAQTMRIVLWAATVMVLRVLKIHANIMCANLPMIAERDVLV